MNAKPALRIFGVLFALCSGLALGAAWAVTIALVATVWEHARPGNARSA